jgi:trigger factor
VQTQVEELPENRVRLTVQVPSHDVHHAVEHAADDLAESVKVPGFRKGKVPRQVLLQRVGTRRLMTEAVESHIGGWFWNAAARTRVRPVEQPHYDFELPASADEDWEFTATVAVQAKPELPDWTQLEVGVADVEVPEELVRRGRHGRRRPRRHRRRDPAGLRDRARPWCSRRGDRAGARGPERR